MKLASLLLWTKTWGAVVCLGSWGVPAIFGSGQMRESPRDGWKFCIIWSPMNMTWNGHGLLISCPPRGPQAAFEMICCPGGRKLQKSKQPGPELVWNVEHFPQKTVQNVENENALVQMRLPIKPPSLSRMLKNPNFRSPNYQSVTVCELVIEYIKYSYSPSDSPTFSSCTLTEGKEKCLNHRVSLCFSLELLWA